VTDGPQRYGRRSMCSCPGRFTTPRITRTTASKPTTGDSKLGCATMHGLKRDRSAQVIVRGHSLIQNLRRGGTVALAVDLASR
jgi:hypothetical protein